MFLKEIMQQLAQRQEKASFKVSATFLKSAFYLFIYYKNWQIILQGPILKKLKVKVGEERFPPIFLSPHL